MQFLFHIYTSASTFDFFNKLLFIKCLLLGADLEDKDRA